MLTSLFLTQEEQYEREFDKYFVRRKPLGLDKDHNRYWYFPRESRLFVESEDSATWGYYQAKEEVRIEMRARCLYLSVALFLSGFGFPVLLRSALRGC